LRSGVRHSPARSCVVASSDEQKAWAAKLKKYAVLAGVNAANTGTQGPRGGRPL